MTGLEVGAIAAGVGTVAGWLVKHVQHTRNGSGESKIVEAVRAELRVAVEQIGKDVRNAVTVALLEAEVRQRERGP